MKVYTESRWYYSLEYDGWCFVEAGEYDPAMVVQPKFILRDDHAAKLVKAMDEQGHIRPRLDERLRVDDLKITHRLLDLLEIQAKK